MAISISSKGRTLHHDLNEAKISGNAYLGAFKDKQKGALEQAIDACIVALDVDTNGLHNTSLTIAASLTTSSINISIS